MPEEIFDVVNEDDEVIAQQPRSEVHRTDDWPLEPGAIDCSVKRL